MLSPMSRTFEPANVEISFFTDEYGERWAQAKGIFQGLELSITNVTATLERHVFPEYRRQFAIGRGMPAWHIKYEGVIQLGMMAKSQHAQSFQRWVFAVIKEVVQTGQYTAKAEDQQYFQPFGLKLMHHVDRLADRLVAELDAREPGMLPGDLVGGFGVAIGAIGAIRRSSSKAEQFKRLVELCDKPVKREPESEFDAIEDDAEFTPLPGYPERFAEIKAIVKSLIKEEEQN